MEKVVNVSQKTDPKTLNHLLNNTKLDQVFDTIRQEILAGDRNSISYVNALFLGCPPTDEIKTKRRYEIFKFCISILEASNNLESRTATELLSILLIETETFPTSTLIKIAEYLASIFKRPLKPEGKWLEVIPKVLSTLSVRDTIVYQGLDTSGADLKKIMIKSLCGDEDELSQSATLMLPVVLKDVNLTKDEVDLIVSKLLAILPRVGYQEMPTFMHQFLLFSSKGQRKKILQSIIAYFINENNRRRNSMDLDSDEIVKSSEVLASQQMEGTVILLLKVNARQDRGLGKDLVATIKSLQYNPLVCLSPFLFSIALSLACIQRYEEVLDILKAVVLRAFKQKVKARFSAWVRDILCIEHDIVAFIEEAINNSKHGWDYVGQGLVKFGFLLLDSFGPKLVCGRIPNKSKPHTQTVSEHICALGRLILRNTFKTHRSIRSEVFEQILTRVITKTSSPVSHYIDVLSQTVQSDPQLLLEILAKLIEVLDYLPLLPYENAVKILKALTPLLKISMPLKDALMLILRKALFHRELEARKIAVSGYITILKRINAVGKLSLSQSQSSMSSQGSSSSLGSQIFGDDSRNGGTTKSESMCLEIMGIMKRILMQQAEVKQLLYESLYDVAVKNSSLNDIILELLLSQFEKFNNTDQESTFCLNISSCIKMEKEKVILEEPLAHLISAISLILYEIQGHPESEEMDFNFDQSPQNMLQVLLTSLVTKVSKSEVDCPELERARKLDEGFDEKLKSLVFLLLNIYEALIEYSFLGNMNHNVNGYEEVLLLFQKYKTLSEKLQSAKTTKSTKNKQNIIKLPDTILTIRFFGVVIEALFSETDDDNEGLKLLRSNNDFVIHIVSMCNLKLLAYSEQGKSDGFSVHMERTYDYICTITKIYLGLYTNGLKQSFPSFETFELSSYFLKGLSIIFSYMFSIKEFYSQKLIAFLAKSIPSASNDNPTRVLKKFQKLTIKALADPENDEKIKEVVLLLSIITDICTIPAIHVKEDVYLWVKQLSIEQTFEDILLAKKLISLCLTLSHQQKDCLNVLRDISSDIHHYLGDIESSTISNTQTHYNVVTAKTSAEFILIVVNHVEKILAEIDWVLDIMKADALLVNTAIQESLVKQSDSFHMKEGNVCLCLLDLIKVFHELVQTEIPLGTASNALLKATNAIYKCLTVMCKYYLSRYDQKTGYLHPMFPKVVKISGTHLTTAVYAFITYIQTKESETIVTKKKPKSETAVKVVREIKTIPSLVFSIELYERHLIMLSKKSKKNLMSHMKLSTARDFRIEASTAEAAMNQDEEDDNDDVAEVEATLNNDNEAEEKAVPETPPKKKRKITKKSMKKA